MIMLRHNPETLWSAACQRGVRAYEEFERIRNQACGTHLENGQAKGVAASTHNRGFACRLVLTPIVAGNRTIFSAHGILAKHRGVHRESFVGVLEKDVDTLTVYA